MQAAGYITHAAQSRRQALWRFAAYILSFELIAAFVLILPLLFLDMDHSILTNPHGYLARYSMPVALVGGLLFIDSYFGHAREVAKTLDARFVTRAEEPRFVALAEEACTTLGVRLPKFAVIEQPQPNAVTVGEGPVRGMIAVTRGLLDQLDDDELLAVLAHEASHIRQGDTRILAANYALMRTAVNFQTHNPLRIEDWRQLMIPLFIPPALPIILASSAVTMLAMKTARAARRGIKLSRDHVADGEAVRVTHYPEALISALGKVGGRGGFNNSWRAEDLLFDGRADNEGGSHPAMRDRIAAITALGRDLMSPTRMRRDSRPQTPGGFGRRGVVDTPSAYLADGKPVAEPPRNLLHFLHVLTNREAMREWQHASVSWAEWRASDNRNSFGLTPRMVIPVLAIAMFHLVFYWPADGNWRGFAQRFSPAVIVDVAHKINGDPICKPSPCPPKSAQTQGPNMAEPFSAVSTGQREAAQRPTATVPTASGPPPSGGPPSRNAIMLWALAIMAIVIFKTKPNWLKAIGKLTDLTDEPKSPSLNEALVTEQPVRSTADIATRPLVVAGSNGAVLPPRTGFGRKPV